MSAIATYFVLPATDVAAMRTAAKAKLGPPPDYHNPLWEFLRSHGVEGPGLRASGYVYNSLSVFLGERGVPLQEAMANEAAAEISELHGATYMIFEHGLARRCAATMTGDAMNVRAAKRHADAFNADATPAEYLKLALDYLRGALARCAEDQVIVFAIL